jgi:hypothetical protein
MERVYDKMRNELNYYISFMEKLRKRRFFRIIKKINKCFTLLSENIKIFDFQKKR